MLQQNMHQDHLSLIKKRYIHAAWPTSSLSNAVPPPTVLKCRCRSKSPHDPTQANRCLKRGTGQA